MPDHHHHHHHCSRCKCTSFPSCLCICLLARSLGIFRLCWVQFACYTTVPWPRFMYCCFLCAVPSYQYFDIAEQGRYQSMRFLRRCCVMLGPFHDLSRERRAGSRCTLYIFIESVLWILLCQKGVLIAVVVVMIGFVGGGYSFCLFLIRCFCMIACPRLFLKTLLFLLR